MDINLLDAVDDSFSIYAAMTIQNRAIVDARDGLKPSQRQCMYSQLLDKITYKHPFKKSAKSVASALDHVYVHGDASCYALLTRLAKDFAMRYPLEDFEGSYGTISSGDSEASSRYTEMRLGELGCLLYEGIEKECIDQWFDNYDNTEQFPNVVPSLGYYNICNGAMGIATSLATSIPQYNLKEVNEAMIKLLWNPDISFDEIYCPPDFCTGATILNANDVKESHRNGGGRAAIIRSTIDYDEKENSLFVTEIPYGVYAGTICEQIKEKIESGELIGIKNVLDLSTKKANIKIILENNVNVKLIVKKMYKLTSLQNSYTINFVMLDQGKYPKVFTWKEALQAHIEHEKIVYRKIHEFDLRKIEKRLNIIEGVLIAIANIDEVVTLIKSSKKQDEARKKLIERFNFNDDQVTSILKITLSKLINLEVQSFVNEKEKLLAERDRLNAILSDNNLLYKEIEDGMRKIINKFGDERRTKILNLDFTTEADEVEPIEKKNLLIHYTNLGNLYTQESTTLMRTRRGGKGSKVKLGTNEVIIKTINDDNFNSLLVFTNYGKMFQIAIDELQINAKTNIGQFCNFESGEKVTTVTSINKKDKSEYFVFITKNGLIKKTKSSEYEMRRGKSLKAITLKDNDEVIDVLFCNSEEIGILTYFGNYVRIKTEDIKPIGRAASGVKAIKLNEGNYVICSHIIHSTDKYVITISQKGYIKKAPLEEFNVCNRGIIGKKISETKDNDSIVKFLTLDKDYDILIIVKQKNIKISTAELRVLSRNAVGVKAIEINENDIVTDLVRDNNG